MKQRKSDGDSLVYSTDHGRMCPDCGQPASRCKCNSPESAPASSGPVFIRRESKGRKGKVVTVVTGIPLASSDLKDLAKELKQKCGSGGTVKDGVFEVQGDHRQKLAGELEKKGWKVRVG